VEQFEEAYATGVAPRLGRQKGPSTKSEDELLSAFFARIKSARQRRAAYALATWVAGENRRAAKSSTSCSEGRTLAVTFRPMAAFIVGCGTLGSRLSRPSCNGVRSERSAPTRANKEIAEVRTRHGRSTSLATKRLAGSVHARNRQADRVQVAIEPERSWRASSWRWGDTVSSTARSRPTCCLSS